MSGLPAAILFGVSSNSKPQTLNAFCFYFSFHFQASLTFMKSKKPAIGIAGFEFGRDEWIRTTDLAPPRRAL